MTKALSTKALNKAIISRPWHEDKGLVFENESLRHFLEANQLEHLAIQKNGLTKINAALVEQGYQPLATEGNEIDREALDVYAVRGFAEPLFIKPTQYKRKDPEVKVFLGPDRVRVIHRYYFNNGYMANMVYMVEANYIWFSELSVWKKCTNGDYEMTYETAVADDVETIYSRKRLRNLLAQIENLPQAEVGEYPGLPDFVLEVA